MGGGKYDFSECTCESTPVQKWLVQHLYWILSNDIGWTKGENKLDGSYRIRQFRDTFLFGDKWHSLGMTTKSESEDPLCPPSHGQPADKPDDAPPPCPKNHFLE